MTNNDHLNEELTKANEELTKLKDTVKNQRALLSDQTDEIFDMESDIDSARESAWKHIEEQMRNAAHELSEMQRFHGDAYAVKWALAFLSRSDFDNPVVNLPPELFKDSEVRT